MKFSHIFIDRPIFATVLAVFTVLVGAIAYGGLPISQYPDIVPPTIVVSAQYPGASASVAADTVSTPIEQEINGVENMMFMSSQSTSDGHVQITVTFELGTDLDQAQVLVQNRVAIAAPRLPPEVRQIGVTVRKSSPDILMVIHMASASAAYDQLYISNYALLRVRDNLARVKGVGDVRIFGARDYSMRIWLDPERLNSLNMTASDVIAALQQQNLQVAGGALGQPPGSLNQAFQINLQLKGRLTETKEFENIVIKAGTDGRFTRLKDVARVELGALDYLTLGDLDGRRAISILVTQLPGANALSTAKELKAVMAGLSQQFPKGVEYSIIYNPTEFIAKSIHELIWTIFEAMLLVVVVVLIFLQSWRATVIPIVAIPVSLVGAFAVMAAFGYSINNLTLFGLVLAVGIVVDDAIVVVENVERKLHDGLPPREAARVTMNEVGMALISIALVLSAVFIPTAFIKGISGQFYRQFAMTIASATLISAFNSLTLSPALCALLLRRDHPRRGRMSPLRLADLFFQGFNFCFNWLTRGYGGLVRRLTRVGWALLIVYAGLIGLTVWMFQRTPTGFIPQMDQGYLIVAIQLPPAASLSRTEAVVKRVGELLRNTPGVGHTVGFAGFSGATRTNATNVGATFAVLDPFEQRIKRGQTVGKLTAEIRGKLAQVQEALVFVVPPPPVRGIGTGGGFSMYIQDRGGRGSDALAKATFAMMMAGHKTDGLTGVFTSFFTNTPQLYVDVDRVRAQMLKVPIQNIFEALRVNLGSAYVNDFNLFGRTYRVTAQADARFRLTEDDVARLRVRSSDGAMVPLGSLVTFRYVAGPDRVPRYNLYPAAELRGSALPGVSSGSAMAKMEKLAAKLLPDGFSYEWTDLSFQEKRASGGAMYIFFLSVAFVFLALAAQYESWSLPLAIILIVPMCLLSAVGGVAAHGMDVNILTQIGFVVLIGLAAKNAVLIVEFARQLEDQGRNRFQAAVEACRLRLRPILMTSFAFTLGVIPLYMAEGAGAEMRRALGVAVFYGMLGVTFFGLVFTPVFYVVIRSLTNRRSASSKAEATSKPI
jgi:hydrophobe/amphiphile efflux-1 (HAE1) family protein